MPIQRNMHTFTLYFKCMKCKNVYDIAQESEDKKAEKKMDDEIEISVHLWWEHKIRKVTIKKGGTSVVIWFRNFGYVAISDEKAQNIFAGIIKGLLGIKGEIPEVRLTVETDGKMKNLVINKRENLEEFFRRTFIEE